MAGLVYDFNEKLAPYITASLDVGQVFITLTIFFEYGRNGWARIERYDSAETVSTSDKDLKRGEERLKRLMEGKWDV